MSETQTLQEYEKAEGVLRKMLDEKREEVQRLQEQAAVVYDKSDVLTWHLERDRARKMGFFWALTLFASMMLMFHSYANSSMLLTALNGVGFLYNWRSLYVRRNHLDSWVPTGFAWLVVALTLKAV